MEPSPTILAPCNRTFSTVQLKNRLLATYTPTRTRTRTHGNGLLSTHPAGDMSSLHNNNTNHNRRMEDQGVRVQGGSACKKKRFDPNGSMFQTADKKQVRSILAGRDKKIYRFSYPVRHSVEGNPFKHFCVYLKSKVEILKAGDSAKLTLIYLRLPLT